MPDKAPARFWYAEKDGTPVKKYDTSGETRINLPDTIDSIPADSRKELQNIETDTSVLTDNEEIQLGI